MKCLMVVAHPCPDSLNGTLARTAADALRAAGHELRIRNLYEADFQPALTDTERRGYYAGFDVSGIAAESEELLWADVLVLVFPTWWFGLPAILKGWIDRVWAPGVAYDHAPDMGTIRPRLLGLRKTLIVTTLGASRWVDVFVMRRPVRLVLKRAILGLCAPRCRLDYLAFYQCERLTPDQVAAMKNRVAAAIRRI